jgi:hypothetical protein
VSTRHHPGDFPPPLTSTPTSSKAVMKQDTSPSGGRPWTHTPSRTVILWLLISIPLVLWDASYVLLRPYSMPGGSLHYLWTPYALYGTVDYIYGWPAYKARNGFTAAQSALNLVECACYVYYLAVLWYCGQTSGGRGNRKTTKKGVIWFLTVEKSVGGRRGAIALLTVFSAFVMTISKTILYGEQKRFMSKEFCFSLLLPMINWSLQSYPDKIQHLMRCFLVLITSNTTASST